MGPCVKSQDREIGAACNLLGSFVRYPPTGLCTTNTLSTTHLGGFGPCSQRYDDDKCALNCQRTVGAEQTSINVFPRRGCLIPPRPQWISRSHPTKSSGSFPSRISAVLCLQSVFRAVCALMFFSAAGWLTSLGGGQCISSTPSDP